MATVFGNPMGPLYPLGKIVVASAGTPVGLDLNVAITTALGIPSTGLPGYTKAGTPSQLVCNQLIVSAPSTNTGDVFLVFKAQGYNGTGGTSVIFCVPKGTTQRLIAPAGSSPFQLDKLGIDAVNNSDVAYCCAVIVN